MSSHKLDAAFEPHRTDPEAGYFLIKVRPDYIIFVEPTGFITGEVVEAELARLKAVIVDVRREGHPVRILVNISKITKHTSESRSAIKKAAELPFERGAAYGGSMALGMMMQYLQRSIDPEKAHYFRTESDALAYLRGERTIRKPGYRAVSWRFISTSLLVILVLSGLTYLSWRYNTQQVQQDSRSLFSQTVQRTHADLQKRLDAYIQTLYGFRGLFNASQSVQRNEFSAYFKSISPNTVLPGLNAISYITHVPSSDVPSFVKSVKSDKTLNSAGYPNFAIYPASTKPSYDVVTYVEPDETSKPGFDLSSDPTRAATLAAARDSGEAEATATITFATTPPTQGFLITLPIYATHDVPSTLAARQAELEGYVNAVFRYSALFADAFSGIDDNTIAIQVRDDQNQIVYSLGKQVPARQTNVQTLEVGGRAYSLYFSAPTTYGLDKTTQQEPSNILSTGIFTLILIGIILGMLLRSRGRAVSLADAMTIDLEHERNLAIENQHKLEASEKALATEKASVERKVVERTQELAEARAQLEASLRGLPFGFVILDHKREVAFSNETIEQILAQLSPSNAPMGGTIVSRLSVMLKPALNLASYLETAEAKPNPSRTNLMIGATYLELLCIPIIAGSGKTLGSVLILEDVTEEKALQRARDEFFSIASHELRTPLTAIHGNASMMLDEYATQMSDPTLKQMVTDIDSSSKRLLDVVNDFLYVAELEQGKVSPHKTALNITEIAAQLVSEFADAAAQQQLNLRLEASSDDAVALADADRTKQLLRNVIRNALRFTKSGTITLRTTVDTGVVRLSIIDTGTGISPEVQHLLFRKFQQASDNRLTRDSSQSTGLGLYMSKLMAELMGGRLYLEQSEVGKGSTFTFELPRQLP